MKYFLSLVVLFPVIAEAVSAPTDFKEFIELLLRIIQNIIGLLITAIAAGIVYAIALYMMNYDNEKKREEIKGYLIYAVVGLFVVMGIWGIIAIFTSTLGWGIGIPQISPPA